MSLSISNLSLSFNDQYVLDNLNLTVQPGEFLSLLGESGSGKTTLLKSIAGLLDFQSGRIYLNGQDITDLEPNKRPISYVFQDLRLFPHLTVYENIAFPLKMHKVNKKEADQRIFQLLDDVQMTGFGDRHISELSGGQQQRIALARALAIEPQLLLLDEPFSGLDETLRKEMGQLIKKLHEDAKLPVYANEFGDSGADVFAIDDYSIAPGERALVKTGIKMAIPEGYEVQVRPRSGLALKHGITLANGIGTIDSDYRGEIKVILINLSKETYTINNGDRIAQLVFNKYLKSEWIEGRGWSYTL